MLSGLYCIFKLYTTLNNKTAVRNISQNALAFKRIERIFKYMYINIKEMNLSDQMLKEMKEHIEWYYCHFSNKRNT